MPRAASDSRISSPLTVPGCAASRPSRSRRAGWSPSSTACRAAAARRTRSPASSVCTANAATPGASIDATAATSVCASSNSSSSNRMSRTSDPSPNSLSRLRPSHLTVGSPGKRRHAVYLMVTQPWQRCGADVGLPGVPFGFLQQPDMRSQQRMHRDVMVPRRARQPPVRGSSNRRWVHVGNGTSTSRPPGYGTEKSTAAPALCRSARKPSRRAGTAGRAGGWPAPRPGV